MIEASPDSTLSPLTPLSTDAATSGHLRAPIKCLLCDIYGTLLISDSGDIGMQMKRNAPLPQLERLLSEYRIEMTVPRLLEKWRRTIESHHADARTRGVDYPEVKVDQVWSEVLNINQFEIIKEFAYKFEIIINPVWPMPGADTLLRVCREQGIALGIVSNAQFFTLTLFERLFGASSARLGFRPDLVFLSYQHGYAKPSAALFQLAVRRLSKMGIAPDQTAFIGNDMLNDILPSRNVHFQTILFAGDARSLRRRHDEPRCAGIKPDLVVTHLEHLVPYLTGQEDAQRSDTKGNAL